ncbi:MAG: Rrf2 family transcriptional regulator [Gemmatimonadota bacterium]|nr:Rrf2 family transcriptional regulator [Gemmatimonadota bacterium]
MRLTRFSDIGLRALMYLGAHRGRLVPTQEISERLNVSRDHLMKSLQALDAMGLVAATRGRGGGFSLRSEGSSIRLGDLVRSLEPSLALAECFEAVSTCPLTGDCRLSGVLAEAQRGFFDILDRYTVGDLVQADRPRLVQLGAAS